MKQKNGINYFVIAFMIGCVTVSALYAEQNTNQPTIEWIIEQKIAWISTGQEASSWTAGETTKETAWGNTGWEKQNTSSDNSNQVWGSQQTKTQVWTSLKSSDIRIHADCSKIQLHNTEANERARYACELHPDAEMLSSYHQESWWNIHARGKEWEYWICQLMPNSTNIGWIKDDRRLDWKRQVERCVDKWKAVPRATKWLIRASLWSKANVKYLPLYR